MQMKRCGRGWRQVKNGQSYDCQKIRDVFCRLLAVSLSPAALRKPLTHLPPAKSNYISVKRLSLSLSAQWLVLKIIIRDVLIILYCWVKVGRSVVLAEWTYDIWLYWCCKNAFINNDVINHLWCLLSIQKIIKFTSHWKKLIRFVRV